jgi:hypothetical protein
MFILKGVPGLFPDAKAYQGMDCALTLEEQRSLKEYVKVLYY